VPTVEENKGAWDGSYDWSQAGNEWSVGWGGPRMQWYGFILPRLQAFVPATRILEIGCGYGRWTQFLKDLGQDLTVVDLAERCVAACQERFAASSHLHYAVTDGRSLKMIPDASVDLVFSFDSLVHADANALGGYISELPRILRPQGAAFLHHSNLGACPFYLWLERRQRLAQRLKRLRLVEPHLHWRDGSVSAALVEQMASRAGLRCISQEVLNWRTRRALIDCISVLVPPDSIHARQMRRKRNRRVAADMRRLEGLAHLYAAGGKP